MKVRPQVSVLMVLAMLLLMASWQPAQASKDKSPYKPVKRLAALKGTDAGAIGTAKVYYKHSEINPIQRLQVIATGLQAGTDYSLLINGALLGKETSDKNGALEFSFSSLIKNGQAGDVKPLPASIKYVLASETVEILDSDGNQMLAGVFDGDLGISPQFVIVNTVIEAGRTSTIVVNVTDPDGDPITLSVICDKGNFVSVSGLSLVLAPTASDVGTSTCTVKATDIFGLSSSSSFAITVTPQNLAPTLTAIADQTVRAGDTASIAVQAVDPNGNSGLRLSITGAPPFVSLSDNGNGTGTLRISPALNDSQGGRVTIQVTDPSGLTGQTSFNVTVQKAVIITAVARGKPNFFISGSGFGSSGARVLLNGQDMSNRIIGQSDNSITLKGSLRKLNLKRGPNQVQVSSGGITSNTFVVNLFNEE
jgi:hypothetical protein